MKWAPSLKLMTRVKDSHHFNADPDAAFHLNADPDPAFHLNADPDPVFLSNADPDPAFHSNAYPVSTCEYWSIDPPGLHLSLWASIPRASMALFFFWVSKASEFWL